MLDWISVNMFEEPEASAIILVRSIGLIANNKNEKKILFPARGLNRNRCIPLRFRADLLAMSHTG